MFHATGSNSYCSNACDVHSVRAAADRIVVALFIAIQLVVVITSNSRTCVAQSSGPSESQLTGRQIDFNRDIRPILSDKCFHCHGPDSGSREADLRLDLEESAKADRGDYAVVAAGSPNDSELVDRVMSDDESDRMPPAETGKSLKPYEIQLLSDWIEQGAQWSMAWAYVTPTKTPTPEIDGDSWSRNWIDKWILARLESEGLAPSPEADRVTLIRRLSFDLIGLPPTPSEVEQFVDDRSADAYERLVDRLLDSPHFGERMAIYWLDLVRFADTVGYHGDQTHNIWPYRDYVIHAFNQNMPFDQLTREQLAGDLLPNATTDQLIASGYNRLLQTSHEGGVQLKEYRAIYLADRVRNISQVWMGATMGCAQCHNHKFDPITTRDFYAMGAFFADIDDEGHLRKQGELNSLPTSRTPELEVASIYQREELQRKRKELAELDLQRDQHRYEDLSKEVEKLSQAKSKTMVVSVAKPREVRVLPRGNWLDESGELVDPAVPEFLRPRPPDATRRLTRLDLADWLTDAQGGAGGLTARVMVNRLWYLMFGRGIAPVLDDFGGQGQPPEHPELLDALAIEFMDVDWNVKHLVRTIVASSTYRQSSLASAELLERDPYNKLLARQSRYRVSAEMVRDTVLRVSGLLQTEIGGPSVKPYQPKGYYRHLNFPKREYEHDSDSQQWRRGLYVHWQRQFLHPMMRAFDAPRREECTAMRPRSNTSLAALTLLNDPTFVEAARAFAERIVDAGKKTIDERIEFAFLWALSRQPVPEEIEVLKGVYQRSHEYYAENTSAAEESLSTGQLRRREDLDCAELAAWSNVARTVLNLSEATTRN